MNSQSYTLTATNKTGNVQTRKAGAYNVSAKIDTGLKSSTKRSSAAAVSNAVDAGSRRSITRGTGELVQRHYDPGVKLDKTSGTGDCSQPRYAKPATDGTIDNSAAIVRAASINGNMVDRGSPVVHDREHGGSSKSDHMKTAAKFPCSEAEVDARLQDMLQDLRESVLQKATVHHSTDDTQSDGSFYVSPCESFLADEAAMEQEDEMERQALADRIIACRRMAKPRPTIDRYRAPPTKIPMPVWHLRSRQKEEQNDMLKSESSIYAIQE
ncbi:uncharacterized protein LOC127844377 [Dreissena polymorpha]|uniref:Uncharacterized protein n=1 Tax=Dreissena polymorpha TaxID=45954 RepID=A0A9D4EGF3_DREPO|nr:uncharacterized protein LOC127844377 [Dreissena polymorpha]KAH3778694.1 hypothetical protein DPMN_180164 [Dreissena polymorpha]